MQSPCEPRHVEMGLSAQESITNWATGKPWLDTTTSLNGGQLSSKKQRISSTLRTATNAKKKLRHPPVFNVLGPTAETGKARLGEEKKKTENVLSLTARERSEPLLMLSCGLSAPRECSRPTCQVQRQRLGSSQGMYSNGVHAGWQCCDVRMAIG